jgi:hypothetical protein
VYGGIEPGSSFVDVIVTLLSVAEVDNESQPLKTTVLGVANMSLFALTPTAFPLNEQLVSVTDALSIYMPPAVPPI